MPHTFAARPAFLRTTDHVTPFYALIALVVGVIAFGLTRAVVAFFA